MGVVYRARDTRLGRDVAIKVLPSAFAADPDRLQRFEQEARAAAALNHPNILAVYDIGRHDEAPFIVSELLEGETLRARLHAGALPVRKAIDYAVQIAHGLAAAHEKGITHRDIKPENLFVTTDERVKILDFGLAKLTQPDPLLAGATTLPTATALPTRADTLPGVVLGTVGYMAPEQVRGVAADYRADIFALGVVLHEMLSGQRAFHGETMMDTMTAILKEDPPALPVAERHIPPALDRIVSRCLEKPLAARFQSTRDLAFALEALSTSSGMSGAGGLTEPVPLMRRWPAWQLAALVGSVALVAAVSAVVAIRTSEAPADARTSRFLIDLPSAFGPSGIPGSENAVIAVSPDGRQFVFRTHDNRLVTRSMESVAFRPIPGAEGVRSAPAFSPDGRFVAFMTADKLRSVELATGAVQTICDLPSTPVEASRTAWGEDVILFSLGGTGLFSAPAGGGVASPLTTLDESKEETAHVNPAFLSDGRHFVYVRASGNAKRALHLGSIDSADTKVLLDGGTTAAFASGYLVFGRNRSLLAQRLDEQQLELVGSPITIADDVRQDPLSANTNFSVSGSGLLVYQNQYVRSFQLVWVDRQGKQGSTIGDIGAYQTLALSRDDRRLAVGRRDPASGGTNVWIVNLATGAASRLTFGSARESDAAWSPDGARLAYNAQRNGSDTLYEIPAAGGTETALMPPPRTRPALDDWSRDGRFLLYHGFPARELWGLPLSGARTPFLVRQVSRGRIDQATFSPDGRWVAYNADESGRSEVYVAAFDGKGERWQISVAGGAQPRWRADGRELFYLALDGTMMAAGIQASGAAVEASAPRALFKTALPVSDQVDQYAVTGDGMRFILINPVPDVPAAQLTAVLNWRAALDR